MKILRLARESDYAAILGIYSPYVENTRISFEYSPPDGGEFAARMRAIGAKHPVIVCEEDGAVLGYAYTADAFERTAYSWSAELSVYVEQNRRGAGIGGKLARAAEEIAKYLGYRKLYSLVADENAESVAFHNALGYKEVARFPEQGYKLGKWIGVIWFEKELCGRDAANRFPLHICRAERQKIEDILEFYSD